MQITTQNLELPKTLYLESTNRCNLRCKGCILYRGSWEADRDISLKEVVMITNQLPELERVYLHGIGEPLLNKALPDIIQYLKAHEVYVLFNSNGILLNTQWQKNLIEAELDREPQLPGALIGAHYWQHRWFLEENELWTRLDRIAHIPCVIIHGRYDVVAMPRTSWELHQAWPGSELFIVPRSGHMSSEPEMARVITETMDQLADRFG